MSGTSDEDVGAEILRWQFLEVLGRATYLGLNIPIGDRFVNVFLAVPLFVRIVARGLGARPILTQKTS